MSIPLKVKAKSLAVESQIIRKEERKQLGYSRYCRRTNHSDPGPSASLYRSLREHRIGVVRSASRRTGLARAFLKGTPYSTVEKPSRKPLTTFDVEQVAKMVRSYGSLPGDVDSRKAVEAWIST